jgi:hypothetical protein
MPDTAAPRDATATAPPDDDQAAAISALCEQGAQRIDPLRLHLIQTLSRRARGQQGAVRRLLDERLALLVAGCQERCEAPSGRPLRAAAAATPAAPPAAERPLAALLRRLAEQASSPVVGEGGEGAAGAGGGASFGPPPRELKALQQSRRTWSRLSAGQELSRLLAQRPENAGPLNSHLLVLRSLESMRDISPDYLRRFMASVDALAWLDDASFGAAATPGKGTNGAAPGKPRRPVRGRGSASRNSGRNTDV